MRQPRKACGPHQRVPTLRIPLTHRASLQRRSCKLNQARTGILVSRWSAMRQSCLGWKKTTSSRSRRRKRQLGSEVPEHPSAQGPFRRPPRAPTSRQHTLALAGRRSRLRALLARSATEQLVSVPVSLDRIEFQKMQCFSNGRNFGQAQPFAKTKADRIANGDPRLSLEERYGDSSRQALRRSW